MAGSAITIRQDDKQVRGLLGGMVQRLEHPEPALRILGEIGRTSIVRNFEESGRPENWQPSKRVLKYGGKTLMKQGFAGGLMGSINYRTTPDRVSIGTNKIYAAIHQFGGKAGRGHKTTIPARPFLLIQSEDWTEMRLSLTDFIIRGRQA